MIIFKRPHFLLLLFAAISIFHVEPASALWPPGWSGNFSTVGYPRYNCSRISSNSTAIRCYRNFAIIEFRHLMPTPTLPTTPMLVNVSSGQSSTVQVTTQSAIETTTQPNFDVLFNVSSSTEYLTTEGTILPPIMPTTTKTTGNSESTATSKVQSNSTTGTTSTTTSSGTSTTTTTTITP